jgi:hypothetical protein
MSEPLSLDLLDNKFEGMAELTVTDETILSILEGTAEELSMLDYKSLSNISPQCIHKMYAVVNAIDGKVGKSLHKRYSELWS